MSYRIEGLIPWGIVALESLARAEAHVLEPGSLDVRGDVFLLKGASYADAVANVGGETLEVRSTDDGIMFRAAALPFTDAASDLVRRLRSRLVGGALAGYVATDFEDRTMAHSLFGGREGRVRIVRRGMLCEIKTVSRPPGDGSVVTVAGRRF